MKGIIIATESIYEMVEECARRAAHHAGIYCDIIQARSPQDAWRKRLEAFLSYREQVWMLDADAWFFRDVRLPKSETHIIAAPDTSITDRYPPSFDTSIQLSHAFISMPMGEPSSHSIIHKALLLQRQQYGDFPTSAESCLNIAIQSDPDVIPLRMGTKSHWCAPNLPKEAFVIHAAGRSDKLNWLRTHVPNI